MSIAMTQYLRPHGRPRAVTVDRPEEIERLAVEAQRAGVVFELEELMTGEVSITAERGEEDIAIEVVPNGPGVAEAVDRVVKAAAEWAADKMKGEPFRGPGRSHPKCPGCGKSVAYCRCSAE